MPPNAPGASPPRWIRPKGHLPPAGLALLLILGLLPFASIVARLAALPGVVDPGWTGGWLVATGHALEGLLSLESVPATDRERVLYMLMLPPSALLIAIVRLTFGIRMIGFRAILIAVGFQASGIGPSLILIGVVVSIVLVVRPMLMRLRLPYIARVSVIMGISVAVLIGALVIAPSTRSEMLWSVAFFPVIVLGLLAEGIARTLDRDSGLAAIWRSGMTIGVAFLLSLIAHVPLVREVAIQFPELIVTQIVAIVLVSEYFDFRLFQDWDARLNGVAMPRLFGSHAALRVVLVRNRGRAHVVGRIGAAARAAHDRSDLRRVIAALRRAGHTVDVVEGDMTLPAKVREAIPEHRVSGRPGGLVFDLSDGVQGLAPSLQVPALLEMLGVASTGAPAAVRLRQLDRWLRAHTLEAAGVPTMRTHTVDSARAAHERIRFPLRVCPRYGLAEQAVVVRDPAALEAALAERAGGPDGELVIERPVPGREIEVALLGNDEPDCLPLLAPRPGGSGASDPVTLPEEVAARVRETARAAFRALGCRDYALVRIRLDTIGTPVVVDVETRGLFRERGLFERAALAAGLDFDALIARVVEVARERHALAADETDAQAAGHAETLPTLPGAPALAG